MNYLSPFPLRLFLFPRLSLLLSCGSDDDAVPTPLVTRDDYLGSYTVTQQDGFRTFSGSGAISGETVTIEFDISGFAAADDCRAVYARR